MSAEHEPKRPNWGPKFLIDAGSWIIQAAVFGGATAFLVDAALLLRQHVALSRVLATSLVAASLLILLAMPAAPFLTVLERLVDYLAKKRFAKWLSLIPFAAAAAGLGWAAVAGAEIMPTRGVVVTAFALAVVVLAIVARRGLSVAVGMLVAAGLALLVDLLTPMAFYRELHDLLGVFTVGCVMSAFPSLRKRVRLMPPQLLLGTVAITVLAAFAVIESVDDQVPAWRNIAVRSAVFEPRLARALRWMVDLDGDGFSPIAWGADCDDFNYNKNPFAHDEPGGADNNCNGETAPARPTDGDRGLTAPFGRPDATPGTIDRMIIITVDCFRADALTPESMPSLWAISQRGMRLTRLYSGATSTRTSTQLIQRGTNRAIPVASRISRKGGSSTAVIALSNPLFSKSIIGFDSTVMPHVEEPWTADETIEQALADLDHAGPAPHYLWVHLFDAHAPYPRKATGKSPTIYLSSAPAQYRLQLAKIDAALGRFVAALDSKGMLAKTALVITGDHGEGLGDHDVLAHHVGAWEAVTRVPGVFLAPGIAPAVYDGLVSLRDLSATVLGAFGMVASSYGAEDFGRSWFRLRDTKDAPLHTFVAIRTGRSVSGERTLSPLIAIVEGRYKLVKSLEDNLVELYDLQTDPRETRDISVDEQRVVTNLVHDVGRYRDIDQWPRWPRALDLGP